MYTNRVQKRGFGDFIRSKLASAKEAVSSGISRVKEAVSAAFGSDRLPKSFRDNLKKHGEKKIKSIQIVREPLARAVNAFANIITAGTFNEVAKKQGEAGFFHLYSIIELDDGTRLRFEKNERPVLEPTSGSPSDKAQSVSVSGRGTLGEMVDKGIKRMGEDKYIAYDPITNNCQDFLLANLGAAGMNAPRGFIKQDVAELVEKTPSFSKILATKATGLAGKAREIFEELFRKRGGRVAKREYGGFASQDRLALPVGFGRGRKKLMPMPDLMEDDGSSRVVAKRLFGGLMPKLRAPAFK